MISRIGKIDFREIKRVSPSQFYSMKSCAYKSLLAEAFEKKPLLPVSPNAYFGTVLHKMLELIEKGIVKNEDNFNSVFEDQVKSVEDTLLKNGHRFFIPLQKNVRDFGLKKVLLKKHLLPIPEQTVKSNRVKFHSEKWLESKDKLLAGKIDLIIERGEEVELIDFKTGNITQDVLDDAGETFTEIKEEYKEQLKLYAFLYFEQTGKFPSSLILVDLAKQKFPISFSQSECSSIFAEAIKLLHATNESIGKEAFIANPTEINCKHCLYRPACSFYLKHLEFDYSFNDVIGYIKKAVRYQNGNVSVFLENTNCKMTITGLPQENYDELNSRIDRCIAVFNLRKEGVEFAYSATKTTTIYECKERK